MQQSLSTISGLAFFQPEHWNYLVKMSDPEIKKKIMHFFQKNYPKDFNIKEIAEELKLNRHSISTYLKVLEAEKKIAISRNIGKAIMYIFKKEKD